MQTLPLIPPSLGPNHSLLGPGEWCKESGFYSWPVPSGCRPSLSEQGEEASSASSRVVRALGCRTAPPFTGGGGWCSEAELEGLRLVNSPDWLPQWGRGSRGLREHGSDWVWKPYLKSSGRPHLFERPGVHG